jgi:uncharacterized BrkB/YihY/UPF0761 family membrane protein
MSTIVGATRRLSEADGTSHVRALAYQSAFVMISGFVGLVGLASLLDWEQLRTIVQEMALRVTPGSSGRLLQEAARQGSEGGATAAVIGLGAALVSGTLAMAQIERSAHRLHDISVDPPALRRYGRALVLAVTAGSALVAGGVTIGGGRSIATGFGWQGSAATVWEVARWPLGFALAGAAIALIFRVASPGRPPAGDLGAGVLTSLVMWAVFTALLGAYLAVSADSGNPYGSLLTVIAMLLWSAATSLALHLGLSVVAQRSGAAQPDGRIRLPESSPVGGSPMRTGKDPTLRSAG